MRDSFHGFPLFLFLLSQDRFGVSLAFPSSDSDSYSTGKVVALPESETRFGFANEIGSDIARPFQTTPSANVDGQQTARTKGRNNHHIKASILTISVAVSWLVWAMDRTLPAVFPWIFTIFYLLECSLSSTRRYLSNGLSPVEMIHYVNQLREAEPILEWFIECYYYIQLSQREGNHSSSSSREKVITHRARQRYPMGGWRDSTCLDALRRALLDDPTAATSFLKITLSKRFVFSNAAAGQRYLAEEALFQERHCRHQLHHDFYRYIHLENCRHKILVVKTGLSDVAFASRLWYWIASLFGMTVPYRIWFARHCHQADVTIDKEIES